MKRISLPKLSDFNDSQRLVYEEIKASRQGTVLDVYLMLLHSPKLADLTQQLGKFLRYETSLSPIVSELVILVIAKHWKSDYEWHFHSQDALRYGLDPKIISAIKAGNKPKFKHKDQMVSYVYSNELLINRQVDDKTYNLAFDIFGENGIMELTSLIGFYSMLAMTLNEHKVPLPSDAERELTIIP